MSECISMDHEKCIGCGMCVRDCPLHVIELEDGKASMNADSCMECGHCVAICPRSAVSMNGYDMNEVKPFDKETVLVKPENYLNAVKFRRSIRRYRSTEVGKEKIEQIIEAGRYTPTGSNKQNVRYVVMEHPEKSIEKDALETFGKMMKLAKTAETMGLGYFYVGLFVRAARMSRTIRNKLHMTKKETLVTAIAIGYPDAKYQRTAPRKPANIEWM